MQTAEKCLPGATAFHVQPFPFGPTQWVHTTVTVGPGGSHVCPQHLWSCGNHGTHGHAPHCAKGWVLHCRNATAPPQALSEPLMAQAGQALSTLGKEQAASSQLCPAAQEGICRADYSQAPPQPLGMPQKPKGNFRQTPAHKTSLWSSTFLPSLSPTRLQECAALRPTLP